jgi:hypothetical protein
MKKLILLLLFIPLVSFGQDDIEVNYVENRDNSVSFSYEKRVPGSYFLIINFNNLGNTLTNKNQTKTIKSSTGSLFKLKPSNKLEKINFQYSYYYIKGNINPKVQLNYPYILPFEKEKVIKAVELYSIKKRYFNSELPKGWKSYSFTYDESQIVKSIRKGVVIEIENTYEIDNSIEKDYYSEQNSITIEHKDGTMAIYEGFDKNKIKVNLGETVYPQSKLGELAKFDSRSLYRLYLTVFYYKTIDGKSLNTIKSSNDTEISYLTPKFFQNNDLIKIISGNKYKVQFDEKSLFKEMRKREIKKFKASNF